VELGEERLMATKKNTSAYVKSASTKSAKSASTEYASDGITPTPVNEISQIINSVNAWHAPAECASDEEAERRIEEYFNLCVSKGEMPLFETMCLYLGISDDKGKEYAHGEGCSGKMTRLLQNALARLKAIEAKAVYKGLIRDVPYIWRSKQYFDYREPNSKIEDLLLGNVLKDLPSAQTIAQKYLTDIDEDEEEEREE
jgi:hypothetical protein